MASVATPPADQATDLLQKLTLDSQSNTLEVADPNKPSAIQNGTVNSSDLANITGKPFERSITPIQIDANACYYPNGYASTPYYYGAYDGQGNEWSNFSDLSQAVYGDNGSMMYHQGYGYAPYGTYHPPGSPVPTIGHDGQLYGPQTYQYPNPYYQPTTPSGPYSTNQGGAPQADLSSKVAGDQVPLSVEVEKGTHNTMVNGGNLNVNNGPKSQRPSYHNPSLSGRGELQTSIPLSPYPDTRFGYDRVQSPVSWSDGSGFNDGLSKYAASPISHANNHPSGRNQNFRPLPHLTNLQNARSTTGLGQTSGFLNQMYPHNRTYGHYGNTFGASSGFGAYDSRLNCRGWLTADGKYKTRGRGNGIFSFGNENINCLNELNRGPRAKGGFKNQKAFGTITLAVKGQNLPLAENNKEEKPVISEDQHYNKEDFPIDYTDAKFFVIKSYSEDDVHKSIKYNVWASTPNGNKKLDAAYREAMEKPGGCPVFLLFSVNTSGQFVGLAEMTGPVDFDKTVEYWQQDKWNGCFPLKWHIVKDVPNSLLKHITLENNENKPVTNSRDTQEVKLEKGLEVLKIFKGYSSKTSILDDFGFYEGRQRTMQEKKAKQQQLQKQALNMSGGGVAGVDDKPVGKGNLPNGEVKPSGDEAESIPVIGAEKENVSNGATIAS